MLYDSPHGTYTADELTTMVDDRLRVIGIGWKCNGRESNTTIEAMKLMGEVPDE